MHQLIALMLTALALLGCASPSQPQQADWLQRVGGKRIYGLVATKQDIPEEAILRTEACVKRDAACLLMLQQSRRFQYATVAIHDTYVFMKVLVPRDAGLQYGDIIQIDVRSDPGVAPVFVSLGARALQRGAHCDWIDGNVLARRGGVACAGWTYKSLL